MNTMREKYSNGTAFLNGSAFYVFYFISIIISFLNFYFRAAIEEQLGKSLVKLAKTLLIREELE